MASNWHALTRSNAVGDLSSQVSPPTPPPHPLPKKRGRPPKGATVATASSAMSPPETAVTDKDVPPAGKKRGRPLKEATVATASSAMSPPETAVTDKNVPPTGNGDPSSDEEQPPAKKPKVNDSKKNAMSQSGKRGRKQVPLWSPLPERINRVINPGAPDRTSTRRTSAQVAADNKQKADLQRDFETLKKRQIEILAQIEIQQALADEEEDRNTIRTLADADTIQSDIQMSDPIASFTGSEYGGDTEIDEPEEVTPKAPAKYMRKKKPAKGETRAAVDAAIIKGKKKAVAKTSAAKKSQPLFPSGLVSGWNRKGPSRKPVKSTAADSSDEQKLGGLDDEDASAIQPNLTPKSRTNALVVVISNGDDSDNDHNATGSHIKPKAIYRHTNAAGKPGVAKSTSAPSAPSKAKTQSLRVKSEAPLSAIPVIRTQPTSSEADGIPMFARAKWRTDFLSTLYACLGSASNPWQLYEKGSSMVETLQDIVDIVYPKSGYVVTLGDKIYSTAKDRLNEKRMYFGVAALKIVTAFFSTEKYAGKPKAIAKCAEWATRSDGPGVWGTPTPIGCIVPEDHPDYVELEDLFESAFVVDLVAPFIKWCEGSCHDYGHLKGAFAMASAGIERAFKMHLSGECVDVGQFSRELVGDMIDDYVANAKILSERRWAKLMGLCGAPIVKVQLPTPSASSMQKKRRTLYIPSSPAKAEQ